MFSATSVTEDDRVRVNLKVTKPTKERDIEIITKIRYRLEHETSLICLNHCLVTIETQDLSRNQHISDHQDRQCVTKILGLGKAD